MLINIHGTYIHSFEIPILVLLLLGCLNDIFLHKFTLKLQTQRSLLPFLSSMFLFTVAIFTSMLFALRPEFVIKDGVKWIEINIIIILLFLYLKNEKRFKFFYWILFLSCFLFIAEVLINYFAGVYNMSFYRIFPTYESTFAYALALPFIKKKSKWITAVVLICFLSAFFSLSRGAWLGLALVTLYSFRHFRSSEKLAIIIFTLLFFFIVFNFELIKSYILLKTTTITSAGDASNFERVLLLKLAAQAFLSSPVFGIGALNLYDYMLRSGFEGIIMGNLDVISIHNTFLQVAAEEGLFGLSAFLIMIYSIWAILKNAKNASKNHSPYIMGLVNFFIVMSVNLFFGYIASQFRFFIALLFGLVLALLRNLPADEND